MLTDENLLVFLYALPIYQLLFYTVQLISFKRSNPSRRYLGLIMLNLTIILLINAIYYLGYTHGVAILFILFAPLILTLLPLYALYLDSLAEIRQDTTRWYRLVLFIPPALVLIVNFLTFALMPLQDRLQFIAGHFSSAGLTSLISHMVEAIFRIAVPCLLVLQIVVSFAKFRALRRAESDSNRKDPGRFAYLQTTWIGIMLAGLVVFMLGIYLPILIVDTQPLVSSLIFNALLLISGGVSGYLGMKQDALLIQVASVEKPAPFPVSIHDQLLQKEVELRLRPQTAGTPVVPLAEAERIINQLESLMRSNKPYLNAQYSLDELCRQLEVPRKIMTYVLNEVMGKNFYGVINEYRMRDAIRIMENEGKRYTMEAISESVGFKSKSSFYACFRKYTGITPKEFLANK